MRTPEWVISDTHLGHEKIIEYEKRPFLSAHHMDEAIKYLWNKTVAPDDIIIHLGDTAFRGVEQFREFNGYKILVRGNHDKHYTNAKLERAGFAEIYSGPLTINNIIFSHQPIPLDELPEGFINYHGHIHMLANCEHRNLYLKSGRYKNMSVEAIDYKPQRICF